MTFRRRLLTFAAVVLAFAAAVAAAKYVPPLLAPEPAAIATRAEGVWQETDSPEAYKLSFRPSGGASYTVTYERSFSVPFSASLEDDTITIWGENSISAPVWYVTYDQADDTLTVTRPIGGETHILTRLAR